MVIIFLAYLIVDISIYKICIAKFVVSIKHTRKFIKKKE